MKYLFLIGVGLFTGLSRSAARDDRPNLIVILTDDQGYADVGFNGCQDIPTPNLDRIANEGVRCTNGYVTHSVCGPSRAGLMTGRYQGRFGAARNPTVNPSVENNGIPQTERNIAELLKPFGYMNMAVGKWHLGTHPNLRPRVRGFDEFFGFLSGGHNYFPEQLRLEDLSEVKRSWDWYRTKLLRNETPVEIDQYLTDELSHAAVEFINCNHQKPFFLYVAYNAPHMPLQATPKYLDRFAHIKNKKRRTYAAMVSAVDDGVGKILDAVAKYDLDEQTIVFFLSDNGGPPHNGSSNEPLRGFKGSPFEGGVRVPFAVRWTDTLPAGTDYELPVSALDIAATIVAHSGAKVPKEKPLDGVDLVPYLTGAKTSAPHETLYWRWYDKGRYAVRDGNSKLILANREKGKEAIESPLLFDLQADIGEQKNLHELEPEVMSDAKQKLEVWKQHLVPPIAPGLGSWKK
ncbi:MAG: sulfatase-like hydrolase/transferase [Lacipirellulaceae bacterium]